MNGIVFIEIGKFAQSRLGPQAGGSGPQPVCSGPIALQWGRGVIKFRKIQIKEL
jgi:hypothetical protein